MTTNYRVDFRFRKSTQKRFHKAFTFTLADSAEKAIARVKEVRPGEIIEILSVTPAAEEEDKK